MRIFDATTGDELLAVHHPGQVSPPERAIQSSASCRYIDRTVHAMLQCVRVSRGSFGHVGGRACADAFALGWQIWSVDFVKDRLCTGCQDKQAPP